ncbi:MAG: hypothetical protein CL933_15725 [Deltaproteobacteria bacterium]|nr:hypothetical protein [Deltaproteobacteria bacterium]
MPAHGAGEETPDLASLRRFHFTGSAEGILAIDPGSILPALLFPFRDPSRVRSDFPLCVPGTTDRDRPPCQPLSAFVADCLAVQSPGQVLQDNLTRLEVHARRLFGAETSTRSARGVLADAAQALIEELALQGDSATRLSADLDALIGSIPSGAEILPASEQVPLYLVLAAARQRLQSRRAEFVQQLRTLCEELSAVLEVEHAKDDEVHGAAHVGQSVGTVGVDLIDANRLADIVGGHRGTRVMAPEHRQRIEDALQTVRRYLDAEAAPTAFVVGRNLGDLGQVSDVELSESADPTSAAASRFDVLAAEWTELFREVRRAKLALNPEYDPERHDAWAASFGWESFTEDELHTMPCVIAVDEATHFVGDHLADLSRLLLSGRPIHVLLSQDPASDSVAPSESGTAYRLELAYLAMAHREAFVQQSTAARPDHLMTGFHRAISGTRTALTMIDRSPESSIGTWLTSRAAVEARAHPLFRYDPGRGGSWARRLDFTGNPAPTDDWSVQSIQCDGDGAPADGLPLSFTFADFALFADGFAGQFTRLASGLRSDELIELAEYLALPEEDTGRKLPYVWGADETGELCRLMPTFRVVRMARERRGFWRTLQDLAGVRSETVDRAVAVAAADAEARFQEEKEELIASHDRELADVRDLAATDAMQGLAQMLLDTDIGSLADIPLQAPADAPSRTPVPSEPQEVVEVSEADAQAEPTAEPAEEETEEPWVETVLCTSCNDCTAINDRMFVYDDNKQVYLADPTAGTFRQLVEAAEKCPAKCIHPGSPLDRSEPGLDELIPRAEPFN